METDKSKMRSKSSSLEGRNRNVKKAAQKALTEIHQMATSVSARRGKELWQRSSSLAMNGSTTPANCLDDEN